MCVYFLRKAHVGEVQASLWPDEVVRACHNAHIPLL
jgi:aspartate--ammonia ligase